MRVLSPVHALRLIIFVCFLSPSLIFAQSSPSASPGSVPHVIKIAGVFHPADGQPAGAVETVTLSIYAEPEGGAPLWQETQTIALDAQGRYSVLLGAMQDGGIPAAVFDAGEAQWLGTRFERAGEVEGPRVRLASVPYAFKAQDAETLGGHPASDYALTPSAKDHASSTKGATANVALAAPITANVVLPGTLNFLAKYATASDVGPSGVFETGTGMVGIGTTVPKDFFHVAFTNTTGTATGLAVQNLGSTATSYSGMLFFDQNGALSQFQGFNNSTHEYRINNVAKVAPGGAFNGSINFMTGSTSRFFVATNGNVGIGTTSPSGGVELSRAGDDSVVVTTTYKNGITDSAPVFLGRTARGTPAAPTATFHGDVLGAFVGRGYGTTDFSAVAAGVAGFAAENFTDTANGSSLVFGSTPLGTVGLSIVMALRPSGFLGIGTPLDADGVPTATDRLQVFGDARVGTTGTNGCLKRFDGTGLVGTCSSDRRLKKDITPFGRMLDKVAALQPVHYYWRASEFPERHFGNSQTYGLVAQDVEQVLPELVATDSDGFKAIDYSKLPLLTIQAVKELKSENDALKQRVSELERLVDKLLAANTSAMTSR
jgi:hypothetical protein